MNTKCDKIKENIIYGTCNATKVMFYKNKRNLLTSGFVTGSSLMGTHL